MNDYGDKGKSVNRFRREDDAYSDTGEVYYTPAGFSAETRASAVTMAITPSSFPWLLHLRGTCVSVIGLRLTR